MNTTESLAREITASFDFMHSHFQNIEGELQVIAGEITEIKQKIHIAQFGNAALLEKYECLSDRCKDAARRT